MLSKGLYKEGLRQGRVVGVIFSTILILMSIIFPITTIMQAASKNYGKALVGISGFNPILPISFCLFAPFMILAIFSFLNKRNRSDFFHSLPYKRETISFSYLLSALTWVIGTILICTLLFFIISFFGSAYVTINYTVIIKYILSCVSASILVIGAVMLSMSFTGTMFSNIVVALMILFMPRFIMMLFISGVDAVAGTLCPISAYGIFGGPELNIAFNLVYGVFGGNISSSFDSISGIIYSLVLGIIYTVLALIAFKHRKSETAGASAPNPRIQSVIRVLLSFILLAAGCTIWLVSGSFNVATVILFTLGIILFFAYELITTRRISGITKTLPSLAVLIILSIAFMGGAHLTKGVMTSVDWSVNKIDSFTMYTNRDPYSTPDYTGLILDETPIDDEELLKYVSEGLTSMQEKPSTDAVMYEKTYTVCVKMKDGKSYVRYLRVSDTNSVKIDELLEKSDAYTTAVRKMPTDYSSVSVENLSYENSKLVYDMLVQEQKGLSYKDWSDSANEHLAYINVQGLYKGTNYISSYLVTENTPNTLKKYIELSYEEHGDKFKELWENYKINGLGENSKCIDINIRTINSSDSLGNYSEFTNYFSSFDENFNKTNTLKLENAIDKLISTYNGKVDIKDQWLVIAISEKLTSDSGGYNYGKSYFAYIPIDKKTAKELKTYSDDANAYAHTSSDNYEVVVG